MRRRKNTASLHLRVYKHNKYIQGKGDGVGSGVGVGVGEGIGPDE